MLTLVGHFACWSDCLFLFKWRLFSRICCNLYQIYQFCKEYVCLYVLKKHNILTGFPFCSPWCRESRSQQAGRPWGCNPARHTESRHSIQERRAAASRSWAAENTAARTRSTSSAAFHHCPSESFLENQTKTCRCQIKRESPNTAIKKIISCTVYANPHDHKLIIKINA